MPAAGWSKPRKVVARVEASEQGSDIRFIVTNLLAGQVQGYFSPTPAAIEYIRAGKLRALAVTTAVRSGAFPDIPTVGEFVPGYEASAWAGIGAPKNTPAEIIEVRMLAPKYYSS
jgi:tripartite-type tricarboxylate transporter receptor subunit TctC